MSFIDDSIKNVKNSVLKEVSAVGGVGGFVGRAGVEIDQLYSGGFHPDSGHGSKNKELLKKQIKDRKKMRADMKKKAAKDGVELIGVEDPIGGYYDVDTEIALNAYEELGMVSQQIIQYNIDNTPPHDTKWKSTGVNIDFDDIYTHIENEEDFINQSETNMKKVGIDIKYDDKPTYAGKNFINKSKTNWELVGE